jgi:hypothetical protein
VSPVYKFSNVGGFLTKNLYTSALAGNTAVVNDKGSMYPIGVFTLASAQATVEFTNIPQTYKHLQIRVFSRDDRAAAANGVTYRLNGDTGSNYSYHILAGDGSNASAAAVTSANVTYGMIQTSASTTSNIFTAAIIDILDYSNTNKNTTIRTLQGYDSNGGGHIRLNSGLWMNTAAVTSFRMIPDASANFIANSTFALYGIQA